LKATIALCVREDEQRGGLFADEFAQCQAPDPILWDNACFSIRLERKLEDLLVGRPPRRFADYVQSEDRQQRRSITRKEYCAYNLHETSSAIPRLQMTALRDRQIAIAQ
jgi:hypothetical protein